MRPDGAPQCLCSSAAWWPSAPEVRGNRNTEHRKSAADGVLRNKPRRGLLPRALPRASSDGDPHRAQVRGTPAHPVSPRPHRSSSAACAVEPGRRRRSRDRTRARARGRVRHPRALPPRFARRPSPSAPRLRLPSPKRAGFPRPLVVRDPVQERDERGRVRRAPRPILAARDGAGGPRAAHSLFALPPPRKVVVDDARGVLTTRTAHSELVYNLSANKHITEACAASAWRGTRRGARVPLRRHRRRRRGDVESRRRRPPCPRATWRPSSRPSAISRA